MSYKTYSLSIKEALNNFINLLLMQQIFQLTKVLEFSKPSNVKSQLS